jgi:hypothetical protein
MILFYTACMFIVISILGALEQIRPIRRFLDYVVKMLVGDIT